MTFGKLIPSSFFQSLPRNPHVSILSFKVTVSSTGTSPPPSKEQRQMPCPQQRSRPNSWGQQGLYLRLSPPISVGWKWFFKIYRWKFENHWNWAPTMEGSAVRFSCCIGPCHKRTPTISLFLKFPGQFQDASPFWIGRNPWAISWLFFASPIFHSQNLQFVVVENSQFLLVKPCNILFPYILIYAYQILTWNLRKYPVIFPTKFWDGPLESLC